MRMLATRLHKGDDLKTSIETFVADNNMSAATVISAVGCVSQARLRMAGATPGSQDIRDFNEKLEIISLIGNLGPGRTHLHIALSKTDGSVIGGHLKEGTIVDVTTEIVVATTNELKFTQEHDSETGFGELSVRKHE